jgi:uncharacterized protein (TIGR01777 family)
MNIAITGASGFIGGHLTAKLREAGHSTRPISLRTALPPDAFCGCDAVVHLAGENVAQRWTASARQRIRDSRLNGTRAVVQAMEQANPRPATLICASAIGYYGSRGDEILTEDSAPASDFLGEVVQAWEQTAREAVKLGVRVVSPRFGVVLGRDRGALPKMLFPFRLGVGGRIGTGQQWMSWIHIDDLTALITFALVSALEGPVNAAAPNPVTNADFTRELAHALHRPAIFPVPSIALKLMFGEMASMLLGGQRVVPRAALHAGFNFGYPALGSALADLLGSHKTSGTPST